VPESFPRWFALALSLLALWALWHTAERDRWFWAGTILFCLLFGLGKNAPLYPLLYRLLPGMSWLGKDGQAASYYPELLGAASLANHAASKLFATAPQNYEEVLDGVEADEPVSFPLGVEVTIGQQSRLWRLESPNVIGMIRGSDPELADEYVIYTAHWDHFGIGEPVDGDSIYNGAQDNAAGVASMLEVAKAWTLAQPAPRRSALFIATTAEESGFWGAVTYIENPIVPLENTLAVINIDGINVWGPAEDMTIVGLGRSTLDDDLTAVLAGQGRSPIPDPEPEKGSYFRADHFPFAQAGVPALYSYEGMKFVGKPEDFAQRVWDDYTANRYHQPSDEFDPSWDFTGAAQDVEALLEVGLRISAADAWPEWRPGSEFQAARDAMLQGRSLRAR